MNILLIAEESAGIQVLKLLAETSHRVVGVMASPPTNRNGNHSQQNGKNGACSRVTVWHVAEKMGYRTWPSKLVKDPNFAAQVRAEEVDIILNVHSLYIIHGEILRAPRIGSFNLHPGPLPAYAGLNTVSWAIYRGESEYGVTLHKMVPEIDAGPIVSQSFFTIDERDTALSVYSNCVKAGLLLVLELLDAASMGSGAVPLLPQDLSQRRYFGKEVPEQGRLIWSRPARKIFNFIRACDYSPFPSPWGYPRARLEGKEITVIKAALTGEACDAPPGMIGGAQGAEVPVACGDEWLCVRRLLLDGQPVDAGEVLRGQERLYDGL